MNTSSVAASAPNAVWVKRAGTRQYISRNSPGVEVYIGVGPSEFSPGELMKIALVICNTLSVGHRLAKAPGEDFKVTMGCSTIKDDAEERHEPFQVEVITDLSSLSAKQRELPGQQAAGAVDRHCTMGYIIEHDASYTTTIVDPNEDRVLKHSNP